MVQPTDELRIEGLRVGPGGLSWLGEPATLWRGSVAIIEPHIPLFERRPFRMDLRQNNNDHQQLSLFANANANRFLDVVIRQPNGDYPWEVPVGIVSKRYTLVQHRDFFLAVLRALEASGVDAEALRAELVLTEYGGRMALRFRLPRDLWFDPGDGRKVALRLECFNSVDRSIPLRLMLVWYRLVCANGLILGTTEVRVDQVHNEFLDLGEIDRILATGLARVAGERERCKAWFGKTVSEADLVSWVDGPLRERWGVLAAARTLHIARTGRDGVLVDRFESGKPHEKRMRPAGRVPGSAVPAANAFAVSQVLAWLARERRDVQEQIEWMEAIPGLIGKLIAEPQAGQAAG